jgi:glutamyl/glutaminyl-tRNA synthetase
MDLYIDWVRLDWKPGDDFVEILGRRGKYETADLIDRLEKVGGFIEKNTKEKIDEKKLEKETLAWIDDNGLDRGEILWPMRVALVGREHSPGPFEVSAVLGKKEVLKRLAKAIKIIR